MRTWKLFDFYSKRALTNTRRRRGRSCACCEVQEADGVGAVGGPPKFQLCSACKGVAYCSTTCQSLDWKSLHKRECKVMQGLK